MLLALKPFIYVNSGDDSEGRVSVLEFHPIPNSPRDVRFSSPVPVKVKSSHNISEVALLKSFRRGAQMLGLIEAEFPK